MALNFSRAAPPRFLENLESSTPMLRGITLTKILHYVVNAECMARDTIMLFIFNKVDTNQINHFSMEKTLNYITVFLYA